MVSWGKKIGVRGKKLKRGKKKGGNSLKNAYFWAINSKKCP